MRLAPSFVIATLVVGAVAVGCDRDRAETGTTAPDAGADVPRLVVALDRSGVVTLPDTGLPRLLLDDDVVGAFRAFHERSPRGRLFIRAHRATLHGRLVRIVDLAKEAELGFDVEVVETDR